MCIYASVFIRSFVYMTNFMAFPVMGIIEKTREYKEIRVNINYINSFCINSDEVLQKILYVKK